MAGAKQTAREVQILGKKFAQKGISYMKNKSKLLYSPLFIEEIQCHYTT
jgi:hypothetical protein